MKPPFHDGHRLVLLEAVYLEFILTNNLKHGEGSGGREWRKVRPRRREEKRRDSQRRSAVDIFVKDVGTRKEEGTQNLKFSNLCTVHKDTHLPIGKKSRIWIVRLNE